MLSCSANSEHTCSEECKIFPDLKEFLPPLKFLNSIPAVAQKTFRNIDITFSCVDVCEEFLAVGTNVGIVYLFDQKKEKLHKLRNNDPFNPITCIKLVVSLECLVAVGSKNGKVMAFKIPFEDEAEVEKFTVDGIHKGSVSSITWSKNGIKFFTGDTLGLVVCTEIDHLEHVSRSYIALEADSEIVQLSYHHLVLLVSTIHRSLLYHCDKKEYFQVGQKDRKVLGRFGAVFFKSEDNVMAYASRPGRRIWKSNMNGVVIETLVLKDIIKEPHHSISFRHSRLKIDEFQDFQFGPLKVFDDNLLFSWSKKYIVMAHPQSGIVGSICGFDNITDVATYNKEIYVLQGIRYLLRLAVGESNWKSEAAVGDVPLPIQKSHSELSISSMLDIDKSSTKDNSSPKLLHWFKRKFSDAASLQPNEDLNQPRSQRAHTVSPDLPDIIELDKSLGAIHVYEKELPSAKLNQSSGSEKTSKDATDDIVYHPKVKKKKKKKKSVLTDEKKSSVPETQNSSKAQIMSFGKEGLEISPADSVSLKQDECDAGPSPSNQNVVETSDSKKTNHDTSRETELPTTSTVEVRAELPDSYQAVEEGKPREDPSYKELEKTEAIEILKDDIENPVNVEQMYVNNYGQVGSNEDQAIADIYSISAAVKPKIEVDLVDTSRKIPASEEDYEDDAENNNMISSSDSFKGIEPEGVKLGSDWVQYSGPGQIISFSASDHHIFCVDSKEFLYISDYPVLGLVWKELQQPAEQISVSPSEHIVWALYKGTIYAMRRKSKESWKNLEWVAVARDASYIAVDDTEAWFISSNGKLTVMKDLSLAHPYSYPQHFECSFEAVQIACRAKVIWAVTRDSRVFYRSDSLYVENRQWNELRLPPIKSVLMVAFSHDDVVLIVSEDGTLWFRTGVDCSMPYGDADTWEVEKSNYIYQSSNYVKSAVMKVVTNDLLHSLIYTQYPSLVTASKAGAWYCKQMDNQLFSNQKGIAGHMWSNVVPTGTVASMKWKVIAAEGLVNSKGILWSSTANNELFCFRYGSNIANCVSVELPKNICLKSVVPTANSLWILSTDGEVYVRKEMVKKCPQGVWWQKLDITQLGESKLHHISCSANYVWACDMMGSVYFRVGSLDPPPSDHLSQAWVEVDSETSSTLAPVEKVYVGSNTSVVWAVDSKQNVYVRIGITQRLPVGEKWVLVPSPRAKQLCISRSTVWLLKSSGKIFRRFGITKSNCTGDYWKQIPGKLSYLSVSDDDDLWGIHNDSLRCHSSKVIMYQNPVQKGLDAGNISEEDWEDVMASFSD